MIRLPSSCLVVLVGPSGSGKSTWAAEWFGAEQVVSADRLRALVGEGEHDQRAGTDAFAVLDLVLERRLKRGLLTVVDTLGLDRERRRGFVALARRHGVPVVAVAFDVADAECRARNGSRPGRPVPAKVLADQLRRWPAVRDELAADGFDAVHRPGPVRVVDPQLVDAPAAARRQQEDPVVLDFGLHIATFRGPGGTPAVGPRLAAVARVAEDAGFTGLWVMDHFIQIPQVGRHWDEMLDSWTTLGFLAAHTRRVTLGTLVTGVTYRNVAHLAKIAATRVRGLDGVGGRGHLLSPAHPGADPDPGGGSGERRTLRLVARYADACNLFGDPATVRHKLGVLHRHCADVGRDPAEVRVTHLSSARVSGGDGPGASPVRAVAGTVEEQVGRFRQLAEAGVQTAIVRLDPLDEASVEAFAPVVAAFATSGLRAALPPQDDP